VRGDVRPEVERAEASGWTSSDAAGLPIFPALPRFDECERGEVTHALRFHPCGGRGREFLYPATHQAGHTRRAKEAPGDGASASG